MVPPQAGYGIEKFQRIPPNSTLIFNCSILEFKPEKQGGGEPKSVRADGKNEHDVVRGQRLPRQMRRKRWITQTPDKGSGSDSDGDDEECPIVVPAAEPAGCMGRLGR